MYGILACKVEVTGFVFSTTLHTTVFPPQFSLIVNIVC